MPIVTILAIVAGFALPRAQEDLARIQRSIADVASELVKLNRQMQTIESASEKDLIEERIAELEDKIAQLARKAGAEDDAAVERVVLQSLKRFAPEVHDEMVRELSHTSAASTLRTLALAQSNFYAKDADANGTKDYWVADVSGLHRILAGNPLKPVGLLGNGNEALADAFPSVPLEEEGVLSTKDGSQVRFGKLGKKIAIRGYLFSAIESYTQAGSTIRFDSGNGRNKDRFAICTVPADYGKPCKLTFLVDQTGAVREKDTAGKRVTIFPAEPTKDGWK